MLRWPGLLLRPLVLTFGQNRKNGLSSLSRKSAIFVISLEHCSDVGALMVLQTAQVQDGTVSLTPGEVSRSRSSQHQGTFSAREAPLWNSFMSTTDVTQSDTYGNTIYKRGEREKQTGREKERVSCLLPRLLMKVAGRQGRRFPACTEANPEALQWWPLGEGSVRADHGQKGCDLGQPFVGRV